MQNKTKNTQKHGQRDGFATSLGVIAATLGSAVGLGNIWKFPYVTGENGGAAFILIYLLCLLFVGLPVLITELVVGRKAKSNAVRAFKKLAPHQPWFLTGAAGVLSAFLILCFYTTVAGWVYSYVFKAFTGAIYVTSAESSRSIFDSFITGWEPLLWQWVVLVVTGTVIMAGVSHGIERVTKFLMPLLFILLVLSDVRALTLPNAMEGLKFLLEPDWSKITGTAVLTALGLSFFKLSLGMGTMITYGSYMGEQENLVSTALKVASSDTLVSLMAGMAIFPAVFAFGFEPDAGPSLLFITIPMVFSSMPLGRIFLVLFFSLVAIAATTAMISLLEAPVAYLTEERGWSRKKATLLTLLAVALLGATATLSFNLLAEFKLLGRTMFDFFDFITSSVFMPLSGLLGALFVGWFWSRKELEAEATNGGALANGGIVGIYYNVLKYVVPIAITIILLNGLNFF